MIQKHRLFVNILFAFVIIAKMAIGNVESGHAQSETDWTTPVNLSLSGVASNPVAVIDSSGTIHVIWVDKLDGYKYSQSKDGMKWTFPVSVNFPFKPTASLPSLLADANGSINVFWIDNNFGFYYAQAKPETLGDPVQWVITKLSDNVSNFDATVDDFGRLHVAYIKNGTDDFGLAGVYYRQSGLGGGGSWDDPVRIYQSEYFKASTSLNTNIRMTLSGQIPNQVIYIAWDNRSLKRVFIAQSENAGKTWSEAEQFKGPEDIGGSVSPYNISVWTVGENLLLIWQVGVPGASMCSVYSQWSTDAGKTWGNTINLFGGATACPSGIRFISGENGKVAVLLNDPNSPTLVAWNGIEWSAPQSLIKLPSLSNPATQDGILLGCRQDIFYKNTLYVVGCDQAGGGDVWFLSRKLIPLDEWFSPFPLWDEPLILEQASQEISNLSSVVDRNGNIHAVWAESPLKEDGSKPLIKYSRWDGFRWSTPETIIKNLDGIPLQLTLYLDVQDRLILAWVDGSNGNVLFNWVDLKLAVAATNFKEAVTLPSPSQLNSSPDIVVDTAGRIVVTYAVPYNENRGIYLVQSTDNGVSWSPSTLAFDGVRAQWELIEHPEITVSGDGSLQLIFTRQTNLENVPKGLYYSRSLDGGVNWSETQVFSEGKISWSDVVAYGDQTVMRLWQEENDLVVANLSQMSQDGGKTWGKLLDVTGVSEEISPVALASNSLGQLYFVQLVKKNADGFPTADKFILQGSSWNGSSWDSDETKELSIKGQGTRYSLTAGLTSKSYLGVLISSSYSDSKREVVNDVISLNRFVSNANIQSRLVPVVIPTPVLPAENIIVLPSAPTPVPTVNSSVLFESNDPSQGIAKNLIGIALIGITLIAAFLLLVRRRSSVQK